MNIKRHLASQLQSIAEELKKQADAESKEVAMPFTPFAAMCATPAPNSSLPEFTEDYREWVFYSVFNQLKRQQGPQILCEDTPHGQRIAIDQCWVNFVWSKGHSLHILQLEAYHAVNSTAIKRKRWYFHAGWSSEHWRVKNINEIADWILELHTRHKRQLSCSLFAVLDHLTILPLRAEK